MIKFNNTAVFILSGALMLSFASCSMVSEPASTNKIVNPSVSMGLAENVRKPSRGISNNAAVNYAEYELSEDDDLKVMENKIETKYGIDIVFGEEVRTEFSDESEQLIAEKYTDEAKIKKALIDVDGVLKVYPKTFFYQLRLTEDDPVKIYLTGAIKSLTYPDASITALRFLMVLFSSFMLSFSSMSCWSLESFAMTVSLHLIYRFYQTLEWINIGKYAKVRGIKALY